MLRNSKKDMEGQFMGTFEQVIAAFFKFENNTDDNQINQCLLIITDM